MQKQIALALIFTLLASQSAFAQSFSDVLPDAWFYQDVEALAQDGVIDTSKQTFRPQDDVNRAEMSKFIIQAFSIPFEDISFQTFADVQPGTWYHPYIETLAINGIAIGYIDETGDLSGFFGPDDSLTREQAAKMIVLAAEFELSTTCELPFSDTAAHQWSYPYINTLYAYNILDGYSDGTFQPQKTINRAEIAKIITRSLAPQERPCAKL